MNGLSEDRFFNSFKKIPHCEIRVAETAAHFFFPNTTQTTLGYFFAIASFFLFLGLGCLVVEVFVLGMEDELEAQLIFFWYTIVCGAGFRVIGWGSEEMTFNIKICNKCSNEKTLRLLKQFFFQSLTICCYTLNLEIETFLK